MEYEKHLRRLAVLFNGEAENILLLGGEPLLHPKLTDFMRISRENFPKSVLSVMTNGILLKQQNLDLEICDEDSIDIYEAESAEEIMEFFAKPYPFCRYCDWERKTMDNPWELSKCDIREWT